MKRRKFIRTTGSGALIMGTMLAGCNKSDQREITKLEQTGEIPEWKMVTKWPKNFPGLGAGAEFPAEVLEELHSLSEEVVSQLAEHDTLWPNASMIHIVDLGKKFANGTISQNALISMHERLDGCVPKRSGRRKRPVASLQFVNVCKNSGVELEGF